MTDLTWTPNAEGSEARTAQGTFFLRPARDKAADGTTMFQLTFLRSDGARHRDTHRVIGLFESPYFARQAAEIFPRD